MPFRRNCVRRAWIASKKRDIDGCKVVAEKLVEEILSKGRISLDMLDAFL